jgi:hypothetical protein
MEIINHSKIFKKRQIEEFINLLGEGYTPNKIIIHNNNRTIKGLMLTPWTYFEALKGKLEGVYHYPTRTVQIFVYAQDGGWHSKQLYSLHALVHELRHQYQILNDMDDYMSNKEQEEDCDKFATEFINSHSKKISKILRWKNQWEVEEE